MKTDRRTLPFSGRVAHVSLRGLIEAESFAEGTPARLGVPLADLCATPFGRRERQLLLGAGLNVLDRREGAAFVQAADGYCGWVAEGALAAPQDATHWVSAPASHLYPEPLVKVRETSAIYMGSRVRVVGEVGKFAETADGAFIPHTHLRALGDWAADAVAVAESLLGTPYLWGGDSHAGIDCSGLVQAALTACGVAAPRDSDQQCDAVGQTLPAGAAPLRGDLFFWPGHVAMAVSPTVMIHANGASMSVAYEGIEAALARIAASDAPLQALKRL